MALTPDQRALLKLLLEQRQSYADVASLAGQSTEDARARAREALAELAGEDPDSEVGLTDYLLGQADPIGRADAARHLQGSEHSLRLARELITKLQVIAPEAELPDLPQPGRRTARGAMAPAGPGPAREPLRSVPPPATGPAPHGRTDRPPRAGLADRARGLVPADPRNRLIAALVAATLVVVAIVLIASGAFSGGGGKKSSADNSHFDTVAVKLSAVGGGSARGEAVFANVGKKTNEIALRLKVVGLKPPAARTGSTYVVWLYIDFKDAYALSPLTVDAKGTIDATRSLPVFLTANPIALSCVNQVRISLIPNKQLGALVTAEQSKGQPFGPFIGAPALQGTIPGSATPTQCLQLIQQAAQRAKQPGATGGTSTTPSR
jgi:hypothetical protein